jgi:hypothetical protein
MIGRPSHVANIARPRILQCEKTAAEKWRQLMTLLSFVGHPDIHPQSMAATLCGDQA